MHPAHLLLAASPHTYSTAYSVSHGLIGTVIVSAVVFILLAAFAAARRSRRG